LKKEHAERNEALNDELISQNIYKDWIVTTAFYSAIHYVEYKLFVVPFHFNSAEVRNLEEAHASIHYKNRKSRHETRGALVRLRMSSVSVQYDCLRKWSQNARYVNYNVSSAQAAEAKNCLNKIKTACLTL
jgi:hypothetical protein